MFVFAGQQTTGERNVGQQPQAMLTHDRHAIFLQTARQQVILVLASNERRKALALRNSQRLLDNRGRQKETMTEKAIDAE